MIAICNSLISKCVYFLRVYVLCMDLLAKGSVVVFCCNFVLLKFGWCDNFCCVFVVAVVAC